MKTLVAYASKYGSTTEIAKEICDVLKNNEVTVDLCTVEYVKDLRDYEVIVWVARFMLAAGEKAHAISH